MNSNMCHQSSVESLCCRVQRLEHCLKSLRLVLAFFILGGLLVARFAIVSPARAGEDKPDVHGGLVLLDKNGQSRGAWAVLHDGGVALTMNDARENPRLAMVVDKDGHAEVTLLDAGGNPRGSWVAAKNGETEFSLSDAKGKPRFGPKVQGTGAYWQLNDDEGKTRAMCSVLTVSAMRKAEFALYD